MFKKFKTMSKEKEINIEDGNVQETVQNENNEQTTQNENTEENQNTDNKAEEGDNNTDAADKKAEVVLNFFIFLYFSFSYNNIFCLRGFAIPDYLSSGT